MHCYHLIITILLMMSVVQAETIYTWVDEKGLVHFSDMPQSNTSTKIELSEFNLNPPTPSEAAIKPSAPPDKKSTPALPIQVTITQPSNDDVIRSNNGALVVRAELNRQLEKGEQLQLTINQTQHQPLTTHQEWQLIHLDRGRNSLSIQVLRDGKLIALSQPITVHILRVTKNSVKR